LVLGESHARAFGSSGVIKTKQLVEETLAETLNIKIKYFDFVPSTETGSHTLTFRIDHPPDQFSSNGTNVNSFDYYLFLDFKKNNASVDEKLHWLFRDSAASLSDADTPETIAAKLSQDVTERQYNDIVEKMLSKVSFTDDAQFKPDFPEGWIINRPRKDLCMSQDSQLKIESVVPQGNFKDSFPAEVKGRLSNEDNVSTFARPSSDVQLLKVEPDQARVIAIYVMEYEPECDNPIVENVPTPSLFSAGDGQ